MIELTHCLTFFQTNSPNALEDRIKEHVPAAIRRRSSTDFETIDSAIRHYRLRSSNSIVEPAYYESSSVSGSAIKLHLLENPACADTYDETCFKVLATGRNKFHLDVLEGVYINHQKPILCRQKEFVFHVQLFK